MEVLYEESAINHKQAKNAKFYTIANVTFWIAVVLSIFCLVNVIIFIPYRGENTTDEMFDAAVIYFIGQIIPLVLMVSLAWFAWFIKRRVNVSYDYAFVSGELRIAKVFNINKRKFLYEIFPEEILQVGDVDGKHFERLSSDPMTKTLICTANVTPAEDKFFMYVLVKAGTQKQMYILECREELLHHILKFAKRGALEEGYVCQEDKKAAIAKEIERQKSLQEEKAQKLDVADEQELAAMRAAEGVKNVDETQTDEE